MRYLFIILLFAGGVNAQTLDTTIRDQVFQWTSPNTTKYLVWIPSDWNAGDTNSHVHTAWYGNGQTSASITALDDMTPLKFLQNGTWDARVVKTNGDTVKLAILMIPNYDALTNDTAKMAGAVASFIQQLRIDTSNHRRFHSSHISGGNYRGINCFTIPLSDTAAKYMSLFGASVFMSTTNTGQTAGTIQSRMKGYRYKVYFASNDGNTGTPVSASYTLYNKLAASERKIIDSQATGGHTPTTWDSCMRVTGLSSATGGNATTNTWRFLVGDSFTSGTPPTVNAGADKSILYNQALSLSGTASDADGTISSYLWQKISGPSCTIVSPNSASTSVTGFAAGTYVFQLRATDNSGLSNSDNITVTVTGGNTPPTVDAGPDIDVILPDNSTTLSAVASDPNGTIASYSWVKTSGPSGGTIVSPTTATTTITGLQQGIYVYTITVTDNEGATDTDQIVVTVSNEVDLPIIFRGRKAIIQ